MSNSVPVRLVYTLIEGEGPEQKQIGHPFRVRMNPFDPKSGHPPTNDQILVTENYAFANAVVNAVPQIGFLTEADRLRASGKEEEAAAAAASEPKPKRKRAAAAEQAGE